MEGNIANMGQFIGAGLACVGMGGAGIGVGLVAGNFLSGALRNPAAAGEQIGEARRMMVAGPIFVEARRPPKFTADDYQRGREHAAVPKVL